MLGGCRSICSLQVLKAKFIIPIISITIPIRLPLSESKLYSDINHTLSLGEYTAEDGVCSL